MGDNSSIEWTDATWNPVTGCTKVSPGCTHCYAERMAERLQRMGAASYRGGFTVTLHPHLLTLPVGWKRPRRIFVNSMSDLFHEAVPLGYIAQVFRSMGAASWHTFQVLTKRAERLRDIAPALRWFPHIWQGVSIERADYLWRVDCLRDTPATVKFLSLEPLLGPLGALDLSEISWVIVGGESGPGARPMDPDWVRDIRDKCIRHHVPFFFKQWGGTNKKKTGRLLDGRTWEAMP